MKVLYQWIRSSIAEKRRSRRLEALRDEAIRQQTWLALHERSLNSWRDRGKRTKE
jgi:hypothetical protein